MSYRLEVCYVCKRIVDREEGVKEETPGPRRGQWRHVKRCRPWFTNRRPYVDERHPPQ